MIEVFKDIPNYNGYQVSNFGNVKSLKWGKERILKSATSKSNYLQVVLCKESKTKTFKIHVLVAMAFFKHLQNGNKNVIDHINGIKNDNRVENLRVVTHRENCQNYLISKNKIVGISWLKKNQKWHARILINKKSIHLGLFTQKEDALRMYKIAALKVKEFKNNRQFRELIKLKLKKTKL